MFATASLSFGQAVTASTQLDRIFENYAGPAFAIRFWDGSAWVSHDANAAFGICLRTENAWRALSESPDDVALGAKYVEGEIEVEGDLYLALRALPLIESAMSNAIPVPLQKFRRHSAALAHQMQRLAHWGRVHSQQRDAASIAHHYDKPPEFFKLFLGSSMVYSCAYFPSWSKTLDEAQTEKMDLICRKLDLRRGERFLDVGCGWGSLVLHAGTQYGALSRGISLSKKQVNYAVRHIGEQQPAPECEVELMDFRDLSRQRARFHKIASVGMCEHVGLKHIGEYFQHAYSMLFPRGLFLNHGITRRAGALRRSGPSFIDRYIFPDGELLTVSDMVNAAESAGFEVRDVEDLREHYEETLHRWVSALNENESDAVALTDAPTVRTWRLYMAGCAEAFRRGDIAIHQLLLSKNDHGLSSAAKVRGGWYRNGQKTSAGTAV
jgi:cyclopropane-fatty-acyl-phospholipid synthase